MRRAEWTAVPAAALVLAACAAAAQVPFRHPEAPRIVAIGDLHGDLDATRRVLRLAGAIDDEDRWVGGGLVVVQTGDQLDRGDQEREILHLLERLRGEARSAGGALHVLSGNHEVMNVELDLRYVTPGGYADFADVDADSADSTIAAHPQEQRGRVAAFRPGGPYARLLSTQDVVVMVGDNVFVHGGVRPAHLDYGLERINDEFRAWAAGEGPVPEWVETKDNPTWTRWYSDEPDADDCRALGAVLDRLGAERMIVGHTVQDGGITSWCGGRVWCVDVGMSAHYGGEPAALEITGDTVRVLQVPALTGAATD